MLRACLLLLPFLPLRAQELEAPDRRAYVEADSAMLARRARACRADLKDYERAAEPVLMDRLILCLEHPDAGLRAQVLDRLPDRRLWDRKDFDEAFRPRFEELLARFRNDPDGRVRLHAAQLDMWLYNARRWREYSSPQAQERRERERHAVQRGSWSELQLLVLCAAVLLWLALAVAGRLRGG